MSLRTLEEVEKEITETQAALKDVHGTETEVYARIVGYYRAVKHWNRGKRDEFDQRQMFTLEASTKHYDITQVEKSESKTVNVQNETSETTKDLESVTYEIYTRKTCPNCPPVKNYMAGVDMPGTAVDTDTKAGLQEAAKKGVFATPTVIFYNKAGVETARCHNVDELEAVLNHVTVVA